MTHELQFDERLGSTYYSDYKPSDFTAATQGFMGKRFIRPKKFKGASFASYVSPVSVSYTITGYPMNEEMADLNSYAVTFSYIAYDWIQKASIWGYSYSRISPV